MLRTFVSWLVHGESGHRRYLQLQHNTGRFIQARYKLIESDKRLQRALELALEMDHDFKGVASVIRGASCKRGRRKKTGGGEAK